MATLIETFGLDQVTAVAILRMMPDTERQIIRNAGHDKARWPRFTRTGRASMNDTPAQDQCEAKEQARQQMIPGTQPPCRQKGTGMQKWL